jgi:glutaredoxin
MRVVLYTLSEGCPLCEDARHHLERLRTKRAFDLEILPVDRDPRLALRYAMRVPVLEVDGRELLHGRLSYEDLSAALQVAPTPPLSP